MNETANPRRVDTFGKASTRQNCRKVNLKPSDHLKVFQSHQNLKLNFDRRSRRRLSQLSFIWNWNRMEMQGSAVLIDERSFKPEKSGRKITISQEACTDFWVAVFIFVNTYESIL
jgi:hypothetical protein